MFKNFMMTIGFCFFLTVSLESNFKIAISAEDYHAGNSILFIIQDLNGFQTVAGPVPLSAGKTEFSFNEIAYDCKMLSLVSNQKTVDFVDEQLDFARKDEKLIYLYFEVDSAVNIIRAIVIANNLLADKPFDIVQFTSDVESEEFSEENFFENFDDELSHLNLVDIQTRASVELSLYNKTVLALYALWAVQSAQIKQAYKNITHWIMSRYG